MILNFDPEFEQAAKALPDAKFCTSKDAALKLLLVDVEGIVVRLGVKLDREFLSRFPSLKFVATVTTGLDHIELDFCQQNSIDVISLKGEKEFLNAIHATPEHTWGLLLALVRRIPWAFESVKRGEWGRREFFGTELNGKTIGIVGYGRVGKKIAGYAQAFGMKVIIHDISEKVSLPLKELLQKSDVVSLHIPLNKDTQKYFRKEHFELMKPGALFVNTSRGNLVDESGLLWALESKAIAGAAVDVLADENTPGVVTSDHPLIRYARIHQNLLISPHIAGSTHESMQKTADFIAGKIKGRLAEAGRASSRQESRQEENDGSFK